MLHHTDDQPFIPILPVAKLGLDFSRNKRRKRSIFDRQTGAFAGTESLPALQPRVHAASQEGTITSFVVLQNCRKLQCHESCQLISGVAPLFIHVVTRF